MRTTTPGDSLSARTPRFRLLGGCALLALAVAAQPAFAQTPAKPAAGADKDVVVVTGSRLRGVDAVLGKRLTT